MIVSHKNCTDGLLSAAIARAHWIRVARRNPAYEHYKDVIFLSPSKAGEVFDPKGLILKRFEKLEPVTNEMLEPIYFIDIWPTKLKLENGDEVLPQDWYVEDKCGAIYILDHHETSLPAFEKIYGDHWVYPDIRKYMEKDGYVTAQYQDEYSGAYWYSDRMSGAGLSWTFHNANGTPMPIFLQAAQAADLYRWENVENSREIFAGIDSFGFDLDFWTDKILDYWDNNRPIDFMVDELYQKGKILLDAKKKHIKNIVDRCCEVGSLEINKISEDWRKDQSDSMYLSSDSHRVMICNSSFDQTMVGEEMNERYPDMPALIYYRDKMGNYKFSMRSNPKSDINVRIVCESIGGGGHMHAAGFYSLSENVQFLNNNKIAVDF